MATGLTKLGKDHSITEIPFGLSGYHLVTVLEYKNYLYCNYAVLLIVTTEIYVLLWLHNLGGHAVAQLVEALRYKSEGRGFDSRWCHWNFSLT